MEIIVSPCNTGLRIAITDNFKEDSNKPPFYQLFCHIGPL